KSVLMEWRSGENKNEEKVIVEKKNALMHKLGRKQMTLQLQQRMSAIPERLSPYGLSLAHGGRELVYTYITKAERTGITGLLDDLSAAGLGFKDLQTTARSLEVSL